MAQSSQQLVTEYSKKAAGYYREIIDATAEPLTTSTTNVVVLIQSESGAVMKPVYCKDATALHTIFGNRDSKLEAKGCFGILMAEHVLEQGGIWVMNVKNIDQYKETLQVKQLAVNDKETDALVDETIATVYDTNKFWSIDQMYATYGDGPTLSFASVLNGTVSIVVEKYSSDDYNYTVGETKSYNENFKGTGLDDNDFVSDYLIQVHVFKTDLKTAKLSVPNAFVNGKLNLQVLSQIKTDLNAQYFATYTGAVGDVIDINGNNLNIVTVMNADTAASGVHVAINREAMSMNGVDLLGKQGIVFADAGDALPTTKQSSRLGHTFIPQLTPACIYMANDSNLTGYIFGENIFKKGDVIANEEKTARVTNVQYISNIYKLDASTVLGSKDAPIMPDGQPFPTNQEGQAVYPSTSPNASQQVQFNVDKAIWFYEEFVQKLGKQQITVTNVNAVGKQAIKLMYSLNGTEYTLTGEANSGSLEDVVTAMTAMLAPLATSAKIETAVTVGGADVIAGLTSGEPENLAKLTTTVDGEDQDLVTVAADLQFVTVAVTAVPKGLNQFTLTGCEIAGTIESINPVGQNPTVSSSVLQTVQDNIVIETNQVRLEKTPEIKTDIDMEAAAETYGKQTAVYEITLSEAMSSKLTSDLPIEVTNGGSFGMSMMMSILGNDIAVTPYCFEKLELWYKSVTLYNPNVVRGIVSLEKHYVNGTAARQKQILDRMNDAGIMSSFTDPTIFRCRYMIDSFKTYIEPNAKIQLATLANAAKRFLVLIPAPFYYELRTSKNPDFHNALGQFDMSYVANGSNPDKPSTNSFYYARNADSSKYLVACMNVFYNDGFTDTIVPATGALGKLYYSKHSGTHKVYDIVAGQDWPLAAAGIIKPEFEAGQDDRAAMEKMGTNVLQMIDGVIQIRSNKTVYQTVLSAFNYPESLEKCFFISDYVEPTLSGKLFKYNDADARLAVKQKADSGCDIMVADGAINDYENKCDLENNTVEVRKAGIIVLDTTLYNEYGIRIAVHRTTIKDPEQ